MTIAITMKKTFFKQKLFHTEAKLELYGKYLETFLLILSLSGIYKKIKIFDLFSGTGLYEDGSKGSPLVAYEATLRTQNEIHKKKRNNIEVTLIINESNIEYYDKLCNVMDKLETNDNLKIKKFNKDFQTILTELLDFLGQKNTDTATLIFLDPFGYKEIKLEIINELLSNRQTEIFLFLPIIDIYRFLKPAQKQNKKEYASIKKIIHDLGLQDDSALDNIDMQRNFIESLRMALNFNDKYFSGSFYLEKMKGQYYAIFFMTSHIYGLDRFLDTAWKIDSELGKGSRILNHQLPLFDDKTLIVMSEQSITNFLLENISTDSFISNVDLYYKMIKSQLVSKPVTRILQQLIDKNKIKIFDNDRIPIIKARGFYLNYECYKKKTKKIYFQKVSD